MVAKLGKYKKIITDVFYSFVAYALPTFALYFVIQPIIARQLPSEENGLFLSLLSIVRFLTNIFISPLASLRLLEKKQCQEDRMLEAKYNYVYVIVLLISVVITGILGCYYMKAFDWINLLLLFAFLCLLFFHDYYSIKFRIDLDFKKTTIDNALIVCGFFAGLGLFFLTKQWQYVFIMGYLFGSIYVLSQAKEMVKGGMRNGHYPKTTKRYVELSAANGLGATPVYCDKILIYPMLGGTDVSTYNAAAVVSKVISIISIPIRNVLLSHLVNKERISIRKKTYLGLCFLTPIIVAILTAAFSVLGYYLCKFLYPMFFEDAAKYIVVIVGAVVIDTAAALFNLILFRFADSKLQTILAIIKSATYIILVLGFVLLFGLGLWGFCLATLCTYVIRFIIIAIICRKNITIVS